MEGTSQEMIEEEVLELARKRLGHDAIITFQARRFELKEFVVTFVLISISHFHRTLGEFVGLVLKGTERISECF